MEVVSATASDPGGSAVTNTVIEMNAQEDATECAVA